MLHIPNPAEENCLKEKENHTLSEKRQKINTFANYQNKIVRNSPALDRHVFVACSLKNVHHIVDHVFFQYVMRMISTQIRW